jgi:hypothetical protein
VAHGELVAAGDGSVAHTDDHNADGRARATTVSGRVSEAAEVLAEDSRAPFSARQLTRLDDALTLASRQTGLLFTVYVGELGDDSRRRAEELHASLGESATSAVLVAVSPGERVVEVVTGEESHRRLDDRGAKLAVVSMVATFKESDLVGGMVEGVSMLADQAGGKHHS